MITKNNIRIAIFLFFFFISNFLNAKKNNNAANYTKFSIYRYNSNYLFIPNIIKQNTKFEKNRITLILHCSSDYLKESFAGHIKNWPGPISLGIYLRSPIINSVESLCAYCTLKNFHISNDNLSAHFIYKHSSSKPLKKSTSELGYFLSNFNCTRKDLLEKICKIPPKSDLQKIEQMNEYPINVVRNIARKLSRTNFILIADFDHMFSENFEKKVLPLAEMYLGNNSKNVLVYRIFEINQNATREPKNKKILEKMMIDNEAFIFHHYYPKGHNIPRLKQWFQVPDSDKPKIQIEVLYMESAWEPQFISNRDIPLHDETFPYPVRDNTNLRWAMCRMGYHYLILNDVFMYHRGLKAEIENKLVKRARARAWKQYINSLTQFNQKMDTLFPDTKKKCPKLDPD
ncbi:N-acetyllactosaminide beta-1,3-N-acetylglucosaminyltransferase [Strongyloides ratti]|uniref:N-acetyllactosaminide beta-1,3-N-acetylglucosaminyltransferase n=1 Tax=Strongyloides ratti TaxID=34506 RepID=A0A090LE42_STRRB|nr:N-acetyllactosaminide beta-1,3-N-acetylglucosaminyltransferase [Strongyloides ratti]CEF68027.1 N-acetyllactosaminide beta-1,3-N-acetylglucosaminyltransferase [Strongyloides ratti]